MRFSIGFSGPAGSGVNTSGLFLGQLLAAKGYTILTDKEYASIIKGDNNNFFLYVSDQKNEHFITKTIDYFFAFDDLSITKNQKVYGFKQSFNVKDQTCKHKNVFCFGAALSILNIPVEEGESFVTQQFPGHTHEENITDLKSGYAYMQGVGAKDQGDRSKTIADPKVLMFGNECVAKGAIEAGMDFYAAYPMTPASSLIDVITTDHHVTFFQGEDEIAVSMAMLGAKVGGKRSMCGTSGGGFALMTESIAFSNQAEIGGVYVLAQRDGPSTGTPTYTGQADLNYAMNNFGDTFPIVLAPSTLEEGYSLIGKALNRSDIYQHPVIVLTDKQFSEGYIAIDPTTLKAEPINRGKLIQSFWPNITPENPTLYKRYELTQDGISPWVIAGTEHGENMMTSYEHDEYGATNEDPDMKKKMQDKRFKKMETFLQQEFTDKFYGYEIINPDAQKFFVTWGWNRYVLEDYLRQANTPSNVEGAGGVTCGLIIIKCIQPFDARLKNFLEREFDHIQELIFVEMNHSGQMQHVVVEQCGLADSKRAGKISHQRKYTLFPIFEEEIHS